LRLCLPYACYRTEFVAVLNNQPQGGLAIRQPASDIVAR